MTYRGKPGEVRTYVRTVTVTGSHPSGGAGTMRSETTTRETVLEALPRKGVTTEVAFDRIRVDVTREGDPEVQSFDSSAPAPEGEAAETPFAVRTAPLRLLAGSKVVLRRKPTGMVEAFEGVEALRERMLAGLPGGDPLRPAVERLLSFGSLRYMLTPNLLVPDAPLAVDDPGQFQDIRPLPETTGSPGLLYFRGTFRLKEVKDGVARMEIDASVSLDPAPGMPSWPPAMAPFRNRLRLGRGVCSGWARISLDGGLLLEDEHTTELDLFAVPPDGSTEIPIPTRVVQATRLAE